MRFITDLMIVSQANKYNFVTFGDLLNETQASAIVKEATKKFIFNRDIISQSVVDWVESADSDEISMAEILFGQLVNLFERFNDNSAIKEIPVAKRDLCFASNCKALETLLNCSEKARMIAREERFLLSIVDQMEKIHTSIGGNFTDFIRRNGNAKVNHTQGVFLY